MCGENRENGHRIMLRSCEPAFLKRTLLNSLGTADRHCRRRADLNLLVPVLRGGRSQVEVENVVLDDRH
jgi:hypothetical protein